MIHMASPACLCYRGIHFQAPYGIEAQNKSCCILGGVGGGGGGGGGGVDSIKPRTLLARFIITVEPIHFDAHTFSFVLSQPVRDKSIIIIMDRRGVVMGVKGP